MSFKVIERSRGLAKIGLTALSCLAVLLLPLPAFAAGSAGKVTWRSIGPGEFGAMFGVAISPHNPQIIVAGLDMGNAFMTRDGGKSWRILGRNGGRPFANPAYRGVWGVCFDPVRPNRIFIGSEHGLYRTVDGGANWQLVHGGTADYTTRAIAVDPANPDVVYAACGAGARTGNSWSRGEVIRSTDGGDTWRILGRGGPLGNAAVPGANWVTLSIDPQSGLTRRHCYGRVYLSGQSGFFVSEDGGDTWTSIEERLPGGIVHVADPGVECRSICDLALAPGRDRSTLFATIVLRPLDGPGRGWFGGVFRSDDGGRTWTEKNKGLESSLADCARGELRYCLLAACPAAPGVVYLNNSEGVYKTTDGGESWRSIVNIGTVWLKGKDYDGTPTDWRVRDRSGNFDQSYYNVYGPANGLAVSPTDPNAVAYTDNAGMGLSYDGGVHWTEPGFEFGKATWPLEFGDRPAMQATNLVRSRGFQLINPLAAAIDPFDPRTIAIGYADTGLEISRDGGAWWEWAYHGILGGERNYIRAILFDPAVAHRVYVGGGGWGSHGHVYRSDDSGRTFKAIGIPRLDVEAARTGKTPYVNALALDPGSPLGARALYAATDGGLFKSPDGGRSWMLLPVLPAGEALNAVTVDPSDPHRVYTAPPGDAPVSAAGLYRSEDDGLTWRHLAPAVIGGIQAISVCGKGGTVYAIAFPPGRQGGFWADRSLWRSDDHGDTWRKLNDFLASAVAVNPRNPDRVYETVFAQDVTRQPTNVFRSTDGGKTWQPIADDIALSPGGDGNRIVFDPSNPSRFLVTHNSGAFLAVE
ncbi:MAG: hypothetical protein LC772_01625 [Chloroflexi bacterium]|nr:hypothetical protein [Chloroflexota bacterium]